MQTTNPDGQSSDADIDTDTDVATDTGTGTTADEQSSRQPQQDVYEWWWDERLSLFLETADAIVETCLKRVFDGATVRDDVHVDVLADLDDVDTYHETLSTDRFIADTDGTYDLDWEVETADGVVTEVFLTCHAEYVDDGRDVTTEVDVAIVASTTATETELVSQPHMIHRPVSA